MFSRVFQSTCLVLKSPAIKTCKPPPKQTSRSAPISGREGERYTARIFTGLPASSVLWRFLQLGEARDLHRVVLYGTPDQNGRATPSRWPFCAVTDVIGKPEGFAGVKKCLT